MSSVDQLKLVSAILESEGRDAAFADVEWAIGRIAELEAFVTQIEHLQTEWVTGTTPAQECMIAVSEAWEQVRKRR